MMVMMMFMIVMRIMVMRIMMMVMMMVMNAGALNVRINEQSKKQFRAQNGITHHHQTIEALAGEVTLN